MNESIIYIEMRESNLSYSLNVKSYPIKYKKWQIIDNCLNGNSHIVECTKPLYGFYKNNQIVDVKFFTNSGKEFLVKNVKILIKY